MEGEDQKFLCGRRKCQGGGAGATASEDRPGFYQFHCKTPFALDLGFTRNLIYSDTAFPGQNEGTISVVEGETLYVIEEDKGDGWTRIRRSEDEEGYVPTSYVEVYLDKNAKGAKTYI